MNEHSDLNVSYMPLFEDMSYDGNTIVGHFCYIILLYNIRFTVQIFLC